MRRGSKIVAWGLLTGLVLVVAGCNPVKLPRSSARGKAVSFMVFGDPGELKAYQNLVKTYESKNPGSKIELIHIPSQADYRKRLGTDFAAGTAADVVLLNYRRYAQFAAKGVVEPLGPYLAKSMVIKESDFYAESVAPFKFKGELYGIPQNLSSLVVFYNKKLFDDAKVSYPKPNWTWDDFVATAKSLTRNETYGLGTEVSLQRLIPVVWQAGGEIVDNVENPTGLNLNDPAFQSALSWFVSLRTVHKVIPDQVEEKSEDSETRFQNGRTAMFLNSRRGVPTYREIKGFDWDVAPLPVGKVPAGILHADAYFMPKTTKNKDAAWRFIEYANSVEGQTIVAASGRTVPSIKVVAESPAFLNPDEKPKNSRVFLDTLPIMRAVPVNENWVDLEATATEELERAVYGGASIEEVLKALQDRTGGVLAK